MNTPFDTQSPVIVPATDNQILFIEKLIAKQDWNAVGTAPKYVSRVAVLNLMISWSREYMSETVPAEIARMINGTVGRLASIGVKINALLAHCADSAAEGFEFCYEPLTKAGASKLIDWLKALPEKTASTEAVHVAAEKVGEQIATDDVTDGIWIMADGSTVKVQEARNGSGRLYAKTMDEDGRFEYVTGLIGKLTREFRTGTARKMTLDEAAAYGALYGRCIECGRTLTDEDSIAAGIGPVCSKMYK